MRLPLSTPVPPAVREADWTAYAVVDVVDFLHATTTRFEDDHLRTEVYRYRDRAPPLSVYENDEREYRVTRVTRPLVERVTAETAPRNRLSTLASQSRWMSDSPRSSPPIEWIRP